jgi:arylsulfatase A-like enzyme
LRGAELGALTGIAVAAIDAASAILGSFAGSRAALLLYVFALIVPTLTVVGSLLAIWFWIARRLRGPWITSLLVALPFAAFLAWVPSSWIVEHWGELATAQRTIAILVEIALLIGSVVAARLAAWRPPGRRLVAIAAILMATGSYLGDLWVFPGDYPDFHAGLAGACVAAVAAAVTTLPAPIRRRRAALGLALALAIVLLWLERSPRDAFGPSRAQVFTKLVGIGRSLSDPDGDGYAAVLGGRDCAAFDATRSPAQPEIPENGIDEDCSGTDARWPLAPPPPRRSAPGQPRPSVLWITVDALRADHVGAYGYSRRTTPNVDRLAHDAVVFDQAYAQASKTWDSIPSFLTGRYPSNLPRDYHHRRLRRRPPYAYHLGAEVRLLAETFLAGGYATGAVMPISLLRDMGIGRGFQHFEIAANPTRKALHRLAELRSPFLLWIHYNEPHSPYVIHPGFHFGDASIDRYDSEIAFVDAQLAELFAALAQRGIADSTIVIVGSDHGEEFGEHGGFDHTRKHYRELLHVPLIVKLPGVAPRHVSDVVELVDLLPTFVELCGLPIATAPLDGQSLLATLAGPRPHALGGAFAEDVHRDLTVHRRALFDGRWRLIDDREADRQELYDHTVDPAEQRDLAHAHPDVVELLRERIAVRAMRAHARRPAPAGR